MVREVRKKKLSFRLGKIFKSNFFVPFLILFVVVVSIPIIRLLSLESLDVRQRAAPAKKTAVLNIMPQSGTFHIGQEFDVDLVIEGGGQTFNYAQANIFITNTLKVQSIRIISPEAGGCNFTFTNSKRTPSVTSPSFSGVIASGFLERCVLYTMTLRTESLGDGTIELSRGLVKSYGENRDILLGIQNGNYSVSTISLLTPTEIPALTPTLFPTPTPTMIPTSTPTIPPTPTPLPYLQ